tara:strand:- start:146 stop:1222 length:1077 start_codon:yes stop_codon:yes gene_type:complete
MPTSGLTKFAYHFLQQGKSLAGLAHKEISTKLMELIVPSEKGTSFSLNKELFDELRESMSRLEEIDWQDAEAGIYPTNQLFEAPWIEWAQRYPLIWLDMPLTWKRRKRKNTRDIPKGIDPKLYPDYYLQNFHHQTDGYLSEHSAKLYDIQVEILFNGTADAMRRRVIAPLKKGIENNFNTLNNNEISVLDVATGTGRTLQQIRSALPSIELFGIDLSGSYLKQASRYFNRSKGEIIQLVKGNAENMTFKNQSMNGITCVYLLHELPRQARQNVINECFRVLEPGGIFVLADSIQISDSPKFISIMENFHKVFHEPYYHDYINDDIKSRLLEAGFKEINGQSHFMTRVWTATKPKLEAH